jgi:hypothetical protein
LGITDAQFRRLAKQLQIEPEDYYRNPHHRSGSRCPLWPPESILDLVGGAEVAAVHERSRKLQEAKKSKRQQRRLKLQERYPDWHQALAPAADALFDLNRYAKWDTCSRKHREAIYGLKGGLIRLLYQLGYATEVKLHHVPREGLRCRRCNGTGQADDGAWDDVDRHGRDQWLDPLDEDLDAGGCRRCGGSGWYRPPDELTYVAIRFAIDGRTYGWHQPEDQIDWPYEVTAADETWHPAQEEKPVNLSSAKFADAKAVITYVLRQARSAQSQSSSALAVTASAGGARRPSCFRPAPVAQGPGSAAGEVE